MPCELLPCCQLINEQMKAMPKAADYLRGHICLGDYGYCTWYRIYRDFAGGQVRPDLMDSPDMQEIKKIQQCLKERRENPMEIRITLPAGFPEKYRNVVTKAAGLCFVKKVIMNPPEFVITTRTA